LKSSQDQHVEGALEQFDMVPIRFVARHKRL